MVGPTFNRGSCWVLQAPTLTCQQSLNCILLGVCTAGGV